MKIKIPRFPRLHRDSQASPIPKAYRPWILLSLVTLVGSLLALTIVAGVAFIYFANVLTPIWLMLLGAVAAAGVALGFGGLFLLLVIAGFKSFKEDKQP